MTDNSESKTDQAIFSHADVAVIFDMTRQAIHYWQKEQFTADEIEARIAAKQAEVDAIRRRWEIMRIGRSG